ncbi:hypothetical protein D3C72_1013280 [compost metagenome]
MLAQLLAIARQDWRHLLALDQPLRGEAASPAQQLYCRQVTVWLLVDTQAKTQQRAILPYLPVARVERETSIVDHQVRRVPRELRHGLGGGYLGYCVAILLNLLID